MLGDLRWWIAARLNLHGQRICSRESLIAHQHKRRAPMAAPVSSDQLLVSRIRAGEADAWSELIAQFEGRLLAFVEGRLGRRSAGEDVVQETFLGFLNSLPNYEDAPLGRLLVFNRRATN